MKLFRLVPVLVICALLSFTSCSTESLNEDEALNTELLATPQGKPLEIEILELIC